MADGAWTVPLWQCTAATTVSADELGAASGTQNELMTLLIQNETRHGA
jgi:hypothetical protein